MATLPILRWPDPRLSRVCAPVGPDEDVETLISDMFDTMYAAPGRGLAAPQVGVMKRLFVIDVTWKEAERSPLTCINPEIVAASETRVVHDEACLSIPGVGAAIARPEWIVLRWTTPDGAQREDRFEGFWAVAAQHEYDHLDGKVIFDRLPEAEGRALAERYAALP